MNTWTKSNNRWAVKCDEVCFPGCLIEVVNSRNEKKLVTARSNVSKYIVLVDDAHEVEVSDKLIIALIFESEESGIAVAMRFSKAMKPAQRFEFTQANGMWGEYIVGPKISESLYIVGLIEYRDTTEVFDPDFDPEERERETDEEYEKRMSK